MVLAGDIGGTKCVFALMQSADGGLTPVREATYPTREAVSLESLLDRFLADSGGPRIGAAVFGVAGPVSRDQARLSNVPWHLDRPALARHLGVERVGLINDLVAMGYGVSAVPPSGFAMLNAGQPAPQANAALIAAGTGLGEGLLIWNGRCWIPQPSEGGHTSFAPQDALEDALLVFLRDELKGHVSYERVLSGPGLWNIYRFLRDTERGEEFDWMRARLEAGDPSATVAELGLSGEAPICRDALELFVRIYGEEAGNLALTAMATGGVYLGGGIAPKILPALRWPAFMQGFLAKGRMAALLGAMPVRVMLEPKAPLLGAARYAAMLLEA